MKSTKGRKYDDDKLRYDLIPIESLEGLAEVLTYGAKKYDDNNWKYVPVHKYEAALWRHYIAWKKGEKEDNESKLHHLKHCLANISFLLYNDINGGSDD